VLSQESKKSKWLSKKRQMQGAQLVSFCDAIIHEAGELPEYAWIGVAKTEEEPF
jgi:hypothetical protein